MQACMVLREREREFVNMHGLCTNMKVLTPSEKMGEQDACRPAWCFLQCYFSVGCQILWYVHKYEGFNPKRERQRERERE